MARRTITQRIALEGADEITKQLEAIGPSGAKAATELRNAFREVPPALESVRDAAANFRTSLGDLGGAIKDFSVSAAALGGAVAGVVGAFGGLAISAAKAAAEVDDTAQALGVTTQDYQKLTYALSQSGAGSEVARRAFSTLAEALTDTSKGGNAVTKTLDSLGIIVARNAKGQIDMTRLLGDVADRFRDMPDGIEKTGLAIQLFGKRAGPSLVPLLNEGSAGIKKLGVEAERLGLIFSKEQIQAGAKLDDTVDKFTSTFAALKNQTGLVFAPLVNDILTVFTDLIASARPILVEFAKAVANYVREPVKEILAALKGDSANVKSSWIVGMSDAVKQLGSTIKSTFNDIILPVFNSFRIVADAVAKAVNSIFGTNFSGDQLLIAGAVLKVASAFGVLSAALGVARAAFLLLSSAGGVWGIAIAAVIVGLSLLIQYWPQISQAAAQAWESIKSGAGTAAKYITDSWAAITQFFTDLWDGITALPGKAWDAITAGATKAADWIKEKFNDAVNAVTGYFSSWADRVRGFFDSVIQKANELAEKIKSIPGVGALLGGGGSSGAPGFAGGGYVRGPGTSRSDSIPAMLSNGEYVMPTKAVDFFGVDFFESLRRLRDPFENARRFFADGGLANTFSSLALPGIPRFADGGLVTAPAMQPVNVFWPDGSNSRMQAPRDVVEDLVKRARRATLTSTGRKPGWLD